MQWNFSLNNFGVHLSLQSWRWCLRCCSVIVSSNGMHKVEQNCTKKTKTKNKNQKPTTCPMFKCNTVSVSFSACRCSSVVFSSEVGREKKKESGASSVNGICGCGLPACCCQRAVAGGIIYADLRGKLNTHLALQALFTQSSPVSKPLLLAFHFPSTLGEKTLYPISQACVFVYSSCGKWVFPLSCGVFLPLLLLQAFPLLITGWHFCSCQLPCLFTVHVGSGSSPLSCGVFLPPPLSQAFPLLVAWHTPGSHWSLSGPPGLFIYSSSPNLWCSGCPTLFPTCLYCSYRLLFSFSFSQGGGWSIQGVFLIWPRLVCGSTMVH
jgi:hypothetical protein